MTSHELSPDPQRIWTMSSIGPRVPDGERRSTRLNFIKTRRLEMSKRDDGVVVLHLCHPTSIAFRSIQHPIASDWISYSTAPKWAIHQSLAKYGRRKWFNPHLWPLLCTWTWCGDESYNKESQRKDEKLYGWQTTTWSQWKGRESRLNV
jgi:hypothetical protein